MERKVAVIILNWNGSQKGLLRRYLPSAVRYSPKEVAEVIVADNGSTDDSLTVLAQEFPEVRVMPLGENLGFAEGYNRAIGQLSALSASIKKGPLGNSYETHTSEAPEYVILLNDDVRVTEGWLDPLVAYMDGHAECAALQPKLLKDAATTAETAANRMTGRECFEYAGACGGYLDRLGYPYCRGRIFDTVEEDRGQYDLPAGKAWPVMWATGACLMVRTELYQRAGGLDGRFFAHMEEIDLCWRLRRMGYELVCVPQSKVYHLGGASLPQGNPRKTLLNFRNSIVMLWKNLPAESYRRIILRRKMLDGVAALNFLRQGQWGNFVAVYKAHRQADSMIANEYKASELVGFGTARPMPQERVNILWEYYKKGRRRYSDLKCS